MKSCFVCINPKARLLVLSVMLMNVCGCRPSNQDKMELDGIAMTPHRVDVGNIDETIRKNIPVVFWIQNSSNKSVSLKTGAVPCVCTKLELESDVVPPGEKTKVVMYIDPSNLSGTKTITALILTDDPRFPYFEPQVVGFFGLPKIKTDYDVDLGTFFSSEIVSNSYRLPVEDGIKAEEFIADESIGHSVSGHSVSFSVAHNLGESFLKVDGRLPDREGGHQWTGKLKLTHSDVYPTLKVRATTVACFDVPSNVYFSPSFRGGSPTVDFHVRRNQSQNDSEKLGEVYHIESVLGDKLAELTHQQVGSDVKVSLTAKNDLPIGAFNDTMTLKVKSNELGDFDFRISVFGKILDNHQGFPSAGPNHSK